MAKALDHFFHPESIAVIGASRNPKKPGYVILKNLIENKERGVLKAEIYPVNPKAKEVLGLKAYPSIKEVPSKVECSIIVVPAEYVPKVLRECGEKGVKATIIISSGFSEIGNVRLEEELKRTAKEYGIRIIGPNCLGVFDAYSGVDTIFLPYFKELKSGKKLVSAPRPPRGYISMISQSGALGNAALDYMSGEGIGISKFVSYGNKVDVDESDLIEYLADDENTKVIIMYLENISNGRKFMEVAKRVSVKKPIVALKAGRTNAGAKAAASHTAALAGVDAIYDAAFKQCGVIRVYDMEEMFDISKALALQPPAQGDGVAILTDGGGAGVLAADACELLGLKVVNFTNETKSMFEELKERGILERFAITSNPVDLTGSATTEMYVESLKLLLRDHRVHGIILIALHHVPGIPDIEDFVNKLHETVKGYKKPITTCVIGGSEAAEFLRKKFEERGLPSYTSPERAARALKALVEYGYYLKRAYLNTEG